MERELQSLKGERVAGMLNELSRRVRLPIAIKVHEGWPFLNAVADAGATPVRSEEGIATVKSSCDYPIRFNDEIIGTISAATTIENMAVMAFCVENSLRLEDENLDLSAEVVRLYDEQSLIYSLSKKLGSDMEVESICRLVIEEAEKVIAVSNISVMLLDQGTNELYTRLCKGRDREAAARFRAESSSGLLGGIFRDGEPVTICDIGAESRPVFPYPVTSILCVPLVTDDKGLGMLVASDKLSGEEFWSTELKLMGVLALEAAAAIRKAQLYEEISALFLHTIRALASAVDAKDPYTYGHSNRVAKFTAAICKELGMGRKEVRRIELAAILHDIGKIGTPENILQKPGRLTDEEMLRIREHPGIGAHILSNIDELSDVITWIRHHHEWYDGSGYPDRLSGDDIPLQARIIAIADSFDAMTSERPYRKGMPEYVAVRIMEEFSGSQFDPHILCTFKAVCEAGGISTQRKRHEWPVP